MIRTNAPSGKSPHAVFGLAATETPQARTKEEEELGDLHAGPFGCQVVTEFVEEDRDNDADDKDEDPEVGEPEPGEQAQNGKHRQGAAACLRQARRHPGSR